MDRYFASDIALLKGEYKAQYISVMGDVVNSAATIQKREEVLTNLLTKLLAAQVRGLPANSVLDDSIKPYTKEQKVINRTKNIRAVIEKKKPRFPIFYLVLSLTLSTIIYMLVYKEALSNLTLTVYPEFISVPVTIVVIALLYYGIMVARTHNNLALFYLCLLLAPIYLGSIAFLYVTNPLYFYSVLGTISLYIVITAIILLWAIALVVFWRRKKSECTCKIKKPA